MEKYYSHFNPNTSDLTYGLKNFIVKVNKFLLSLTNDEKYHPSRTQGRSSHSRITFEDDFWSFEGEKWRENVPLVDKATVKFRKQDAWRFTRSSKFITTSDLTRDNIRHCLQEAAKNYDPNLPWRGPAQFTDEKTGLVYQAVYSGTDRKFFIREAICAQGVPVWEAICEGGYVN